VCVCVCVCSDENPTSGIQNVATHQLLSLFVNAQNVPTTVQANLVTTVSSNSTFAFVPTVAGAYRLSVTYLTSIMNPFPGETLLTTVRPGTFSGAQSLVEGNGILGGVAGDNATFHIIPRDAYQNVTSHSSSTLSVSLM
jgi:pantothenate synthetase